MGPLLKRGRVHLSGTTKMLKKSMVTWLWVSFTPKSSLASEVPPSKSSKGRATLR